MDTWTTIESTANLNSYTITGLTPGAIYDFKVRAHNDVGFSEYSSTSDLMAATVPSIPAAPTKFSADQTQITIEWSAPIDDGGSPLTGYKVLWNMGGEEEVYTEAFSTDAGTLAYTKGGLSPYAGLPFKFKVMAQNYQGYSGESDSIRILAAEVPGAPGAPTKVESSKTYIKIRWTASTYNGGVPIESYGIYARPNSDAYQLMTTLTELSDLSYVMSVPSENIGDAY